MSIRAAHSRPRSLADAALRRAMSRDGAERHELLVDLSRRYPNHGPVWLALAEEHTGARRREEAQDAARKALAADPGLAREFSSALAGICGSMMPSAPRADAMLAEERRARRARANEVEAADGELERARRLSGLRRCERLEALSREHDKHAPTWLALAEDYLAQRRIELAMAALETALRLDRGQEQYVSAKLATARRYYRAESRAEQYSLLRREPDSRSGALSAAVGTAGPTDRTRYVASSQVARSRKPRSRPMPAYLRGVEASAPSGEPVDTRVLRALDLSDREARLRALRDLDRQAPEHPAVLFHLAMQLVMANEVDEARAVGDRLRHADPSRYQQLFDWAEEWVRTVRPQASASASVSAPRAPVSAPRAPVSAPLAPVSAPLAPVSAPLAPVPAMAPMRRLAPPNGTLMLSTGSPNIASAGASAMRPASPLPMLPRTHKTQLLAVPAPGLRRVPRATPAGLGAAHTGSQPSARFDEMETRPLSSMGARMRTAGALIAGICAGLLVAMLLVFMVNNASAKGAESRVDSGAEKARLAGEKAARASARARAGDAPDMGPSGADAARIVRSGRAR